MTVADDVMLEPIDVDPPTCEQCGCVIEDLEELIHLRAAELIERWERDDPHDNWKHTGEQPAPPALPYRTPQSTIDAFWYVVCLDNPDYLTRWLAQHPLDAPALIKLWEGRHVVA